MSIAEVRLAEELARVTTRRHFLRRVAQWTVASTSAWAVAGVVTRPAYAHTANGSPQCKYSSGVITCTSLGTCSSACNGHDCPSGYNFYTSVWPNACWCTKADQFGNYYFCCDCTNGSEQCTCQELVRGRRSEQAA